MSDSWKAFGCAVVVAVVAFLEAVVGVAGGEAELLEVDP
jgi:hypothetical protein